MTTVTSTEARKHLVKILDRVYHDKERIIITRRGKPAAVFVKPTDEVALQGVVIALAERKAI